MNVFQTNRAEKRRAGQDNGILVLGTTETFRIWCKVSLVWFKAFGEILGIPFVPRPFLTGVGQNFCDAGGFHTLETRKVMVQAHCLVNYSNLQMGSCVVFISPNRKKCQYQHIHSNIVTHFTFSSRMTELVRTLYNTAFPPENFGFLCQIFFFFFDFVFSVKYKGQGFYVEAGF